MNDLEALTQIRDIAIKSSRDNLGDNLIVCLDLVKQIKSPHLAFQAGGWVTALIAMTRRIDIGWKLFSTVEHPSKVLDEQDAIQLLTVAASLNELCYCFEALLQAAHLDEQINQNPGSTTPIRFYINTICHYVSAYFLLDYRKNKKAGYSQAGNIIRVLEPLGLHGLLNPVREILDKKIRSTSLGEVIRRIRNKSLVHNNFLPSDVKEIVLETNMFSLEQQVQWNLLLLELFQVVLILKLKLFSILTHSGIKIEEAVKAHVNEVYGQA